jgi:hypothetical protein
MGLCKCRVVTTLFCFQHRVNVCENCLVKDHDKCVVKTYLAWLQDSDFDASCKLCQEPVDNGRQVVRLTCHDLFHWECLDKYAKSNFPAHTAPAGYSCPTCKMAVVPIENNVSPVATLLRNRLKDSSWAAVPAAATTVTLAEGATQGGPNEADHSTTTSLPADTSARPHSTGTSKPTSSAASSNPRQLDAGNARRAPPLSPASAPIGIDSGIVFRKGMLVSLFTLEMDADDNKYAWRPANAWFARLVGNRIPVKRAQQDSSAGLKRAAVVLVLLVIAFITLIEVLTRVRPSGDNDALLDPMLNPHLQSE